MRTLCCLLFCLIGLSANAGDTLRLSQWSLTNEGLPKPILFRGAQNILQIIREASPKPGLAARFSAESRAFHDSLASISHRVSTSFKLSPKQLQSPVVELECNYLQTFTEIWVNQVLVGKTDNAFRKWRFRIDPKILQADGNLLEITFLPPRETVMHSGEMGFTRYPADNQSDSLKTAPYIRAPQQEFGWDFTFPEIYTGFRVCPQLIFRPETSFEAASMQTVSIAGDTAHLRLHVQLQHHASESVFLDVRGPFLPTQTLALRNSSGLQSVQCELKQFKPELWYPAGYGAAKCYRAQVVLRNARGAILDSMGISYGIRTVELLREPDSLGTAFYFRINGKPVYVRGANVVMPNAPFEGERSAGLSTRELDYVRNSGMNMLRVWGGGTYLPEAFYTWADAQGVMIWQDYMFACSYYPAHRAWVESVMHEAEYQAFRLSAHPSLALWCGNNEVDVARKNWGWQQKYGWSTAQQQQLDTEYHQLFEVLLPQTTAIFAPGIPYLASTPVSNWGRAEDFLSGDNHDWGIWHGGLPFDAVNQRIPRFMSEYGFPSFPSENLLEQHYGMAPNDSLVSALVLSYKGVETLKRYLREKGYPDTSAKAIIRGSRELQAWHYAKMQSLLKPANGHCMGQLWWQLNEAAPVMSWSLLDFDGRPKLEPAQKP
jgi:beta-mannosidase